MTGVTRLGLVGYGVGGRLFHAPFIQAAEGVELVGVVTRNPARRAEVAADLPGVPAYDTLADLIDAGVDAVTVTTPPATRRALVLEAVSHGVHVVADKPFAPDAAGAQELVDAARDAGVKLAVYQNRRWDADLRTAADLLASGRIGTPWRVHLRMDQDDLSTLERGPTAGLLRDLGAHVVDQMIWLLGPVRAVTAHLDVLDFPEGSTDAAFVVDLQHESGARSYVEASKANHADGKELRIYGSSGSYRATPGDVQFEAIMAGRRPADEGDAWGFDAEERWGVLSTDAGQERIPSLAGRYQDYYTQFGAACRGEGPLPVTGEEGARTVAVLDAARESHATGRTVVMG